MWSAILNFLKSYMNYHNSPNVVLTDLYFIPSLISLTTRITGFFIPIIDRYLNIRLIYFLSALFMTSGYAILYNTTKFIIFCIGISIFSIGRGLIIVPAFKNLWLYFPDKKGLISGLVYSSGSASDLIFTSLAFYIINPNYVSINKDGKYPYEVAENVKKLILIIAIICGCFSFSSVFLMHAYEDKKKDNKNSKLLNLSNIFLQVISSKEIYIISSMDLMATCKIL